MVMQRDYEQVARRIATLHNVIYHATVLVEISTSYRDAGNYVGLGYQETKTYVQPVPFGSRFCPWSVVQRGLGARQPGSRR